MDYLLRAPKEEILEDEKHGVGSMRLRPLRVGRKEEHLCITCKMK